MQRSTLLLTVVALCLSLAAGPSLLLAQCEWVEIGVSSQLGADWTRALQSIGRGVDAAEEGAGERRRIPHREEVGE